MSTVAYYENLLRDSRAQWLADRMWWISVTPGNHQSIQLEDVYTVLSGGTPPETREEEGCDLLITLHCPVTAFFVHRSETDGTISILNLSSGYSSLRDYCRALSGGGATALGVVWGGKVWETLLYAENGEILAIYQEGFSRELGGGTTPETLEREMEFIHQFSEDTPEGVLLQKAAALAILEARSGLRISEEWLNSTHQAIYVDTPVEADYLEHPTFAAVEPDIAASLAGWPKDKKSALLFWVIDHLSTKFGFDWPEIVDARDALAAGGVLSAELREKVMDRTLRLGRKWLEGTGESSDEDAVSAKSRWRAGIAVRVALRELEQPHPAFSSLRLAKEALGAEWTIVRQKIQEQR
ncbi:hypothetical protein ACFQX6_31820 [Streptosporangium lutulentum]